MKVNITKYIDLFEDKIIYDSTSTNNMRVLVRIIKIIVGCMFREKCKCCSLRREVSCINTLDNVENNTIRLSYEYFQIAIRFQDGLTVSALDIRSKNALI